MHGFGWQPPWRNPEFEITERWHPQYYVLFMRMRGNEGEWIRLHWRSDYFPSEDESLVCDLEDWR